MIYKSIPTHKKQHYPSQENDYKIHSSMYKATFAYEKRQGSLYHHVSFWILAISHIQNNQYILKFHIKAYTSTLPPSTYAFEFLLMFIPGNSGIIFH